MNVTDKGLYACSGDELRQEIKRLEGLVEGYKRELAARQGDGNSFKPGFYSINARAWLGFDTISEAVDAIVEERNDFDARHLIQNIYY